MAWAIVYLLAGVLPATLLLYFIGVLLFKKLRLTGVTITVGFLVAWLSTTLLALFIADQPTVNSATEAAVPAAIAGSISALVGVAISGKRKSPDQS